MEEQLKTRINELVGDYLADGNEVAANEAYGLLMEHEWDKKKHRHAAIAYEDVNEVLSLYGYTYFKALQSFEPGKGDFVHFVNRAIENAVRNLRNHRKVVLRCEYYEPESMASPFWEIGEDAVGRQVDDPYDMVDELSEADRAQARHEILAGFTEVANDFERDCLGTHCATGTIRATAQELGTYPMKVQRALRKVRTYYDRERFGDVEHYLVRD